MCCSSASAAARRVLLQLLLALLARGRRERRLLPLQVVAHFFELRPHRSSSVRYFVTSRLQRPLRLGHAGRLREDRLRVDVARFSSAPTRDTWRRQQRHRQNRTEPGTFHPVRSMGLESAPSLKWSFQPGVGLVEAVGEVEPERSERRHDRAPTPAPRKRREGSICRGLFQMLPASPKTCTERLSLNRTAYSALSSQEARCRAAGSVRADRRWRSGDEAARGDRRLLVPAQRLAALRAAQEEALQREARARRRRRCPTRVMQPQVICDRRGPMPPPEPAHRHPPLEPGPSASGSSPSPPSRPPVCCDRERLARARPSGRAGGSSCRASPPARRARQRVDGWQKMLPGSHSVGVRRLVAVARQRVAERRRGSSAAPAPGSRPAASRRCACSARR